MSPAKKKSPPGLSPAARRWWKQLVEDYSIDDPAGMMLLETALVAWDRLQDAQRTLATEGAVLRDRFNQLKPHPAVAIERDARVGFLAAMKALNLDLEPLKGVGRPGQGTGITSEQLPNWRHADAD